MTEILGPVTSLAKTLQKTRPATSPELSEREAVRALVRAARGRGEELTGPDGLLRLITKEVLEAALEEELTEHLGYDKHDPEGRNNGNSRNGSRTKTVLTDNAGPVTITVPRDRDGSFEPVIVPKHKRRLAGRGDGDSVAVRQGPVHG